MALSSWLITAEVAEKVGLPVPVGERRVNLLTQLLLD